MATVVVSGRIDEKVRQKADAIMRKAGITPNEVIQNVWSTMVETGSVPVIANHGLEANRADAAFDRFDQFLNSLPPVNPHYADMEDDDILSLRVRDYV